MLDPMWPAKEGLPGKGENGPPGLGCTCAAVFFRGAHEYHPTYEAWAQLAQNHIHDDNCISFHQTLAHSGGSSRQEEAEFGNERADCSLGKERMFAGVTVSAWPMAKARQHAAWQHLLSLSFAKLSQRDGADSRGSGVDTVPWGRGIPPCLRLICTSSKEAGGLAAPSLDSPRNRKNTSML